MEENKIEDVIAENADFVVEVKEAEPKSETFEKSEKEKAAAAETEEGSHLSQAAIKYQAEKKAAQKRQLITTCVIGGIIAAYFLIHFIVTGVAGRGWLGGFARFYDSIFATFLVFGIAFVIVTVLARLIRGSNRRRTILTMASSFTKYIAAIVWVFIIVGIWVPPAIMTAIMTGAGVIGLVVGFGAQNLIGDILAGVFIVFENNFSVGDIITFGGFRGEVKEIGIRTTKLCSSGGDVNIVNNSEIRNLVNMTVHRSYASVDLNIENSESIERIEHILRHELQRIADKYPSITEGPDYLGVAELNDRGMLLRIVAKCHEANRMQLTRDLNREFKILLDKNSIRLAAPRITVDGEKR